MKLELIDGVLDAQEEKEIIKMLNSSVPLVGFGVDRTYQRTDKVGAELKIRVENKLLPGSKRFRNVWIKPLYN